MPEPKKKRRYIDILKVPLEKLTGWQEVQMDLPKMDAAFERTRTPLTSRQEQQKFVRVPPVF